MIHIAICDDDKNFISYMKRMITIAGQNMENVMFYEYTSGTEFIFDLETGNKFDLLVLDMQLGDADGDAVAGIFRKYYPYSVLVFCSGVRLPTVKSFKATPFRYLLKSYTDAEIIEELREILKEVDRNNVEYFITGHFRHSSIKVNLNNIVYITNAKRGSRIVVAPDCREYEFGEQILLDDRVSELYEQYKEHGFEQISAGYLVNIRYVKQLLQQELVLYNGEKLPVARGYYKMFKERFAKNLARKY